MAARVTSAISFPTMKEITTSKPWRWTIGRIDFAVRFAFQALSAVFQVLKIIVKIPIAFLITPIFLTTANEQAELWAHRAHSKEGEYSWWEAEREMIR